MKNALVADFLWFLIWGRRVELRRTCSVVIATVYVWTSHITIPSMWTVHPCEQSIHVNSPSMWTVHLCEQSIHVNSPSMWTVHPCEQSIYFNSPSMWTVHPCEQSIHVDSPSMWAVHRLQITIFFLLEIFLLVSVQSHWSTLKPVMNSILCRTIINSTRTRHFDVVQCD